MVDQRCDELDVDDTSMLAPVGAIHKCVPAIEYPIRICRDPVESVGLGVEVCPHLHLQPAPVRAVEGDHQARPSRQIGWTVDAISTVDGADAQAAQLGPPSELSRGAGPEVA